MNKPLKLATKLNTKLNTTQEIIDDIKAGKMVILVDDEDRENEGDLVIAAKFITPEAINFMARYGRGLICMPIRLLAYSNRASCMKLKCYLKSLSMKKIS